MSRVSMSCISALCWCLGGDFDVFATYTRSLVTLFSCENGFSISLTRTLHARNATMVLYDLALLGSVLIDIRCLIAFFQSHPFK